MNRLLLPLLSALALPALAGMPAGIAPGDKNKEILKKIENNADFKILNANAKTKLEGNWRLTSKIGGQLWRAEFVFDKRSKDLTQLIFVGNKAMKPEQYDSLLKSFYVYTSARIGEHFQLGEPVNTPDFGKADSLKKEEMFPLHAYKGEGILLTAGLWKDAKGGIRLCFSMQPNNNTALGKTYTPNTAGKQADWENIPVFETTDEGKEFLIAAGLMKAPETETDGAEDDSDSLFGGPPVPKPEPKKTTVASTELPQVEQDVLNALLRLEEGKNQEGLAKLVAAGKEGNARALYELACCYAGGEHGVDANAERAEAAFRQAAEKGYALALAHFGAEFPTALTALGLTAEDGNRMVKETMEAAKGGSSPSACFNLAIMLRYGYGIRKDVAKAVEIMQTLKDEGDPAAARLAEQWTEHL